MGLYEGSIAVILWLYPGYIRVILGLYWCYIGVLLGLYWGYIGVILGLYGVILGFYWGYIRVIYILGLYWENGKEDGNEHLGFRAAGPSSKMRSQARGTCFPSVLQLSCDGGE